MSITLPSLSNAREQGKRVTCLSNMRNLTQGWMMYAMENDEKLCSADTDWDVPPKNYWVADEQNESERFIGFLETSATNELQAPRPAFPQHKNAAVDWARGKLIRRLSDENWGPADSSQGQLVLSEASAPNANGERPFYYQPE